MPKTYPFKTLSGRKRRTIAGLALSISVSLPYIAFSVAFYEYWWRSMLNLEHMAQVTFGFWDLFGLFADTALLA